MDTMLRKRNCRMGSCGGSAITALDHQALCLKHFLLCCYERLEGLDPRGRKFSAEPVDVPSMRAFVEEDPFCFTSQASEPASISAPAASNVSMVGT